MLEQGLITGCEKQKDISCDLEQVVASICGENTLRDFLSLKGLPP